MKIECCRPYTRQSKIEVVDGTYEEDNSKICRFNDTPCGRITWTSRGPYDERLVETGGFCKDDECLSNRSNRDIAVRSEKRLKKLLTCLRMGRTVVSSLCLESPVSMNK